MPQDQHDTDSIKAILKEHCSQALTQLFEGNALWKGWNGGIDLSAPSVLRPGQGVRSSQNTSNHYTKLFDTNPANADFPKRRSSLICSLSRDAALGYANTDITMVLPFNNASIAVCPGNDIWNLFFKINNSRFYIKDMNEMMASGELGTLKDASNLTYQKFKHELENADVEQIKYLTPMGTITEDNIDEFKKQWLNLYDYKANGFKLVKPNELGQIPSEDHEVWLSDDVVVIPNAYKHIAYEAMNELLHN